MDIAPQLQTALDRSRADLASEAGRAARAQTSLGTRATDATMAALAQAAIFSEALLSAIHARMEEIKSVTK